MATKVMSLKAKQQLEKKLNETNSPELRTSQSSWTSLHFGPSSTDSGSQTCAYQEIRLELHMKRQNSQNTTEHHNVNTSLMTCQTVKSSSSARKKVLPSLVTFELVGSSQDVAESSSGLEVQETLHLQVENTTASTHITAEQTELYTFGRWETKRRTKSYTGSLVSGGLLTCLPNTSSWNCSSWTTRLDRDLFVGGSAWMYWRQDTRR